MMILNWLSLIGGLIGILSVPVNMHLVHKAQQIRHHVLASYFIDWEGDK